MEGRLKKVIEVLKKYFQDGGLFYTRNIIGDKMTTIATIDGVTIDVCYSYGYFEIFGLTSEEQNELDMWYKNEVKEYHKNVYGWE